MRTGRNHRMSDSEAEKQSIKLNKEGLNYMAEKNWDKAIEVHSLDVEISQKHNMIEYFAISNGLLGTCYTRKHEFVIALQYHLLHLKTVTDHKIENSLIEQHRSLTNVGDTLLALIGLLEEQFERSYVLHESCGSRSIEKNIRTLNEYIVNPLVNLGIAFEKLGDVNRAIDCLTNALDHADNKTSKCLALNNMSLLYFDRGQYKDAYDMCVAILNVCKLRGKKNKKEKNIENEKEKEKMNQKQKNQNKGRNNHIRELNDDEEEQEDDNNDNEDNNNDQNQSDDEYLDQSSSDNVNDKEEDCIDQEDQYSDKYNEEVCTSFLTMSQCMIRMKHWKQAQNFLIKAKTFNTEKDGLEKFKDVQDEVCK
ncbi:MAG: hypothetical protein EZS28_008345 [Streblomastix strix]|uniref:Uncharacterized protein n=1 Tax=Streblomastix strix TaxID=222440 RepID=A0A5J4WPK3_9EUKA|nr:MAG: hypothetical protein EZS28_008345 [Streblomastix strix]